MAGAEELGPRLESRSWNPAAAGLAEGQLHLFALGSSGCCLRLVKGAKGRLFAAGAMP